AELRHDLGERLLHGGFIADVGADREAAPPLPGDDGCGAGRSFRIPVDDGDISSFGAIEQGDCFAEPCCSTGHNSYAPIKLTHTHSPLIARRPSGNKGRNRAACNPSIVGTSWMAVQQ